MKHGATLTYLKFRFFTEILLAVAYVKIHIRTPYSYQLFALKLIALLKSIY